MFWPYEITFYAKTDTLLGINKNVSPDNFYSPSSFCDKVFIVSLQFCTQIEPNFDGERFLADLKHNFSCPVVFDNPIGWNLDWSLTCGIFRLVLHDKYNWYWIGLFQLRYDNFFESWTYFLNPPGQGGWYTHLLDTI